MANKNKLYIMVMLCKPQNLHFRAERVSTTTKAKFYISHLFNITTEFVILRKRQGQLELDPKGAACLLRACHPLPYQHSASHSPFSSNQVGAIAYIIWNLHSLFLICVFQVPLHPKQVKAVYFGVFISSQSTRLDFLLSSLSQ